MNSAQPTAAPSAPPLPASAVDPVCTTGVVPSGPGAGAILIETALLAVAGEAVALVSLTLDYGASLQPGDAVTLEASIERATRTLVFAHGRVLRADGVLALTGSAVFRRLEVSGAS